jgi:hypothetical protein
MSNATTFAARMSQLKAHSYAGTGNDSIDAVLGLKKAGSIFEFTAATNDKINQYGILTDRLFDAKNSTKSIMRFVQYMNACVLGLPKFDVTTCALIVALEAAGGKGLNYDALEYLLSRRDAQAIALHEGRSPNTKGVQRSDLKMKVFDKFNRGFINVSTVRTQMPRTIGVNGFLGLTGATKGEERKQFQKIDLNSEHILITEFHRIINGATENQIDEMLMTNKEKKELA